MPDVTPKGITHPVGPDTYNATSAFTALAKTTDAAISNVENRVLSSVDATVKAESADTKAFVSGVLAAHQLGNTSQAQIDAAVKRVLESQTWRSNEGLTVKVEDYGAVGDGVTDDAAAIQAAIDNAWGAAVDFASGKTYGVGSNLRVPSGAVLRGNGCTVKTLGFVPKLFSVEGSTAGLDVNLVGSYGKNAFQFKTETPHGLQVGETFRLVGQRQVASIDAPSNDRLGMATGDKNSPFNGEYLTVRQVISATEFQTTSGTIFGAYQDNNAAETKPDGRPRTTLNKMNWAKDVLIQDFFTETEGTWAVVLTFARDCLVSNVRDLRTGPGGATFGALGSYRVLAHRVHSTYPTDAPKSVAFYGRNTFKVVSSQNVVLDSCSADGGGQVVDMSYMRTYLIPTINCTVRNSTFWGFDSNPLTTHPGVIGAIIEGNDFRAGNMDGTNGAACGIAVRSPYSIIRNNTVYATQRVGETGPNPTTGNYGIRGFDGGGHHLIIQGNTVIGFDDGIDIIDGNEEAERHGELHTLIEGNTVQDCARAIAIRKSSFGPSVWSVLTIATNRIEAFRREATGVHLDTGAGSSRGQVVSGNHMHFAGNGSVPIRVGKATADPVITGNVVTGNVASFLEVQPGAVAGQRIHLSGNVVVSEGGVQFFPPKGETGTVAVSADSDVFGAFRVGSGSASMRAPYVDGTGALTGRPREWVEGLVSKAANLNAALSTAQDARLSATRAEQAIAAMDARVAAADAAAKALADQTGDTGWRQLDLPAGITGAVYLRRKGRDVHMMFSAVASTTAGTVTVVAIPAGFKPPTLTGANWRHGAVSDDAGTSIRQTSYYGGAMRIVGMETGKAYGGSISFVAGDPFPTTMPGKPV